jgi:hypothetical protein
MNTTQTRTKSQIHVHTKKSERKREDLQQPVVLRHFQQYSSDIVVVSFIDGGNRIIR